MRNTYLQATNKRIINNIVIELFSEVFLARPPPKVLPITTRFTVLKYHSSDNPHDNGKGEEAGTKNSVIYANFLGSSMTATAVSYEDSDA